MSEGTERAPGAGSAPESRFGLLWRRFTEHRVAQWTVGYVGLAYAIQHAVILTSESFEWPNIVARVSMLLLVLGLPLAITLAWYHGAKVSSRVSGPELTIISLLLVGISILFYVYVKPGGEATRLTVQEASVAAARPAAAPPNGAISLAVLPFVNLSSDKEQEFFSDGMTEEITAALAKVPNLSVVGRTSAFQFKGENKDLRAIGQALSATHLIEGSVRKDGNEIRITAQLIKAVDGTHLWTETYDRELKGVFAIQEEIATAIAGALRVPLGLKDGQSLVANRASDTDSYQDYLRARALVRARGPLEPGGPLTEAAKLLEQVVAHDPNYAPAWGLLGQAYAQASIFTAAFNNGSTDELRRMASESMQKAEAAAQHAARLEPNNIDGYNALGYAGNFRGQFVQAEDLFKRALLLDPGNPEALHQYSYLLATVGRLKDSLAMRLRLQAQEPFVPAFTRVTAQILWLNGQNDAAIASLTALPATFNTRYRLAQVFAAMGRYSEAADTLRDIPSGTFLPGAIDEAVRLLRTAGAHAESPRTVVGAGQLGFAYLYAGNPNSVLDYYEGLAAAGVPALGNNASFLWAPSYASVRKTERFKAYARKAGMTEYWKARGWPDLCHPTTGDDFACQ